ncbi:SCF E3 ubiquitin ligase complex F-box protein grrA AltName: Full=F-box and leucine-rich repeat protein grrA [Rhizoctonia solani AG-1 IB]|uniref:Rhizoctonia solani AG1-IB WGS project CAOJ00000000 data, isolate 7/3/14, contig 04234 n=1 Tax=Thanatephorus cucumeris (strain AG1-IB / isolate 7/3/14) TaxID=1108050 RepID=M5BMH6_THACB|nr:SCF E3 ubiquitin ligase complex F-box protein grrA AltName: Full=F-box and leucine-rich repeat protein grrA [Rhizoctonia solani AG-1 IB]
MSTQPLLQRTAQKRIALPVRVEPKVFFANERTFLSWLHFTVVLGGLAVGLLNFGDKVGRISAGMFSLVAIAVMIYALVTYHWRAAAIAKRGSGPYDDRLGPTILCIALLVLSGILPHCSYPPTFGSQFEPALFIYNHSSPTRRVQQHSIERPSTQNMFISSNRPTASPAISVTSVSDDDEDLENSAFYLDGDNKARVLPAQFSSRLSSLSISEPRDRTASLSLANSIPPEVLIHIFRLIPLLKDLYACLLVSRTWCACAIELMWHKPMATKTSSLWKLLNAFGRDNLTFHYASFVRRLNFMAFGSELHDHMISRIADCTRLERLTLVNCVHLTDESLEGILSKMPNLVALDLTGVSSVSDRSIGALARTASRLQGINLGGCKMVTDEGIIQLATHCTLLRRVKLASLQVTNQSVIHLARQCPLLLEMDLNGCTAISNDAIRELWSCSGHIRELKLGLIGIALTDDAFPVSAEPQPRMITSPNGSQSPPLVLPPETSLTTTRSFEHLRILDLTGCASLTDAAVEGIISVAPKIRNLVLAKCILLTDNAIASVCKLGRYLHYLHLGHVSLITDRAVIQLARTCTRLRYVDLACCTQLTDLSVSELATLVKLRRIGLVRVINLTDQAVFALSERQSSLERIHLSYCEQITIPAIHFLLQRLHKLTHLSLTGIPAFRREELQRYCRTPPREFNPSQRAAFCVYSGKGVADLRRYLEYLSSTVDGMRGPTTSDTEDDGDDDDISQLEDFITYPQLPNAGAVHPNGQLPNRADASQSNQRTPNSNPAQLSGSSLSLGIPGGQPGDIYAPAPYRPGESSSPTATIVGGSRRIVSGNSSASASSVGIPTPDLVFAESGASLSSDATIRAPQGQNSPLRVSHPVYFASTSSHHVIDTSQPEPTTLPGDRVLAHSVREALGGGEVSGYQIGPEGGSDTDTPTSVSGANASPVAGPSSSTSNNTGRGRLRMLRVADYTSALPWKRNSRRGNGDGDGDTNGSGSAQ